MFCSILRSSGSQFYQKTYCPHDVFSGLSSVQNWHMMPDGSAVSTSPLWLYKQTTVSLSHGLLLSPSKNGPYKISETHTEERPCSLSSFVVQNWLRIDPCCSLFSSVGLRLFQNTVWASGTFFSTQSQHATRNVSLLLFSGQNEKYRILMPCSLPLWTLPQFKYWGHCNMFCLLSLLSKIVMSTTHSCAVSASGYA